MSGVRSLRRGAMAGRGAAPPSAPAFRAATSATAAGGAVVVTPPGTIVVGDLLVVAAAASFGGAVTWTTPTAGWTKQYTANSANSSTAAYWKIAEAGDLDPQTWTPSGGGDTNVVLAAYSGITASPLDAWNAGVTTDTTIDSNAVTTTAANDLVVVVWNYWRNTNSPATKSIQSNGGNFTRQSLLGAGDRLWTAISDQLVPSAGAAPVQSSLSSASSQWSETTMAFKAA